VAIADSDVAIKPPRSGLVFMVAWIGFLCLLIVAGAAGEHNSRGLWLVFLWLPWLVPVALIARSRVIAAGDTLTSRGPFRTRAWRRDEIDGFAITQSGWSHRVSRIEVHTAAGAWVPLSLATASGPLLAARQQRWLSALEAWHSGASRRANKPPRHHQ
jgi:Bacterial PH domain